MPRFRTQIEEKYSQIGIILLLIKKCMHIVYNVCIVTFFRQEYEKLIETRFKNMERIKCLKKWYIEIDGFIFKICCEKLFSAIIKLETAVCCTLTKNRA